MSADRKPLHPLSAAGMILAACGAVAWAWTSEWRWGITGLAAFLVLAVIGTVLDGRRSR